MLSQTVHLFHKELQGPEAFAVRSNGEVYTGLDDGRIVQILLDSFQTIAHIDPLKLGIDGCRQIRHIGKCGRPLGLRFDPSNNNLLYILDPNYGLWTLNLATHKLTLFLSSTQLDDAKFLDDFIILEKSNSGGIDKGKVFYFTDASRKWQLPDVKALLVENDHSGRLLSYDTETKKVKVEVKDIPFPNGIELTDDRSAVLVASFTTRKIWR